MIYIYRVFLGLPAAAGFFMGYVMLDESQSAMQQTVGMLGFLIGAVFFTGYIIVESIMLLRKELNHLRQENYKKDEDNGDPVVL